MLLYVAVSVNEPSTSVRSSGSSRESFNDKLVLLGEAYRRKDLGDNESSNITAQCRVPLGNCTLLSCEKSVSLSSGELD